MSSPPPPLDLAILRSYSDGDVALENELLAQFLESSSADVAALRAALGSGELDAIGHAAHRVKGSSQMIGAEAQGLAADRIETAARDGRRDDALAAAPTLEAEHARLMAWLRKRLSAGG